jgi:hypothetical protein
MLADLDDVDAYAATPVVGPVSDGPSPRRGPGARPGTPAELHRHGSDRRGVQLGGGVLVGDHGDEAFDVLAQRRVDPLPQRVSRCCATGTRSAQTHPNDPGLDLDELHGASVRADVGPDLVQRAFRRTLLVDTDPIGIEQPGDGRVVAQFVDASSSEQLPEPNQRRPMQSIDTVEQADDLGPDRLRQCVDGVEAGLEVVQQSIEVVVGDGGLTPGRRDARRRGYGPGGTVDASDDGILMIQEGRR